MCLLEVSQHHGGLAEGPSVLGPAGAETSQAASGKEPPGASVAVSTELSLTELLVFPFPTLLCFPLRCALSSRDQSPGGERRPGGISGLIVKGGFLKAMESRLVLKGRLCGEEMEIIAVCPGLRAPCLHTLSHADGMFPNQEVTELGSPGAGSR